jgi:hypothetical protein
MKQIFIILMFISTRLTALANTSQNSDCHCKANHSQNQDFSSLAAAVESASKQDAIDFHKNLKAVNDQLASAIKSLKTAKTNHDKNAENQANVDITVAEDILYDFLDSNRPIKRQLNDATTSLVLESIYLGNTTNTNDIYGDILLDYYNNNPVKFKAMLDLLKQETPATKYQELVAIYESTKEEQRTGANDPKN